MNDYLAATRDAVRKLTASRGRHAHWRARAERKLAAAKDRHDVELAKAQTIEAEAWRELLALPGMTPATAAAVTEIDRAEVARWVRALNSTARRPQQRRVSQ